MEPPSDAIEFSAINQAAGVIILCVGNEGLYVFHGLPPLDRDPNLVD
jgi:hypothetical protein